MHCFVALNRALCAIKGTESQTSVDPSLNRAVILLDDVIEIRNNATAASSTKRALLFKLLDNGRVRRISIHINYARARMPGSGIHSNNSLLLASNDSFGQSARRCGQVYGQFPLADLFPAARFSKRRAKLLNRLPRIRTLSIRDLRLGLCAGASRVSG